MESGRDKSIVRPSRSFKRNQDCSETSKRVLPTVGPGEASIGEAEGRPAPMSLFSFFHDELNTFLDALASLGFMLETD